MKELFFILDNITYMNNLNTNDNYRIIKDLILSFRNIYPKQTINLNDQIADKITRLNDDYCNHIFIYVIFIVPID